MFAIAFDMEIADLRKHFGDPYNKNGRKSSINLI